MVTGMLYRTLRFFNVLSGFDKTTLQQMQNKGQLALALRNRFQYELTRPLSYVLPLTGMAMQPSLNTAAKGAMETHDQLVIRRLYTKSSQLMNDIYVNDVVVIMDPEDKRRKYVRRIAGLAGATLNSDRTDEPDLSVPQDHCWVVRDNETASDARDSRSFGPLAMENILGRVMYYIRSATDHGKVENSFYAMLSDSIVLSVEDPKEHVRNFHRGQSNNNVNTTTTDDSNIDEEKTKNENDK